MYGTFVVSCRSIKRQALPLRLSHILLETGWRLEAGDLVHGCESTLVLRKHQNIDMVTAYSALDDPTPYPQASHRSGVQRRGNGKWLDGFVSSSFGSSVFLHVFIVDTMKIISQYRVSKSTTRMRKDSCQHGTLRNVETISKKDVFSDAPSRGHVSEARVQLAKLLMGSG